VRRDVKMRKRLEYLDAQVEEGKANPFKGMEKSMKALDSHLAKNGIKPLAPGSE
jgi:hypothetical protein